MPDALTQHLKTLGLHAQPLDPSAVDGPLSGWFRIDSADAGLLDQAVRELQQNGQVLAAYRKPAEGPPA